MKLLGSYTSPFVRRIRILMDSWGLDYQFEPVDLSSLAGQKAVSNFGPLRLIPLLEDGDLVLSNSRTIVEYLLEKTDKNFPWTHQEYLTVIDTLNDTLIQFLLMERSGIDTKQDNLYFKNKRK